MASLKMGLLACSLAVAPAVFASTQELRAPSTAEPPGPATSASTSGRARNIARPIFFGLVAMAFLIASGLAAQSHRKARSRRGGSL